jgi:hypothetical protein
VKRPVECHLGEVQPDDPVISVHRMLTELVEHPRHDPLIAPCPQRGVGDLVLQDRFDADPGTAGDQSDEDPPEAQPVRYPGPVTAQRMGFRGRGDERLNRSPDGIYNFAFECAHDIEDLRRVVVVWSHSGSNPSQLDDRWMVTFSP